MPVLYGNDKLCTLPAMNEKKLFSICALVILYVTMNVACDPLAYRTVAVLGVPIAGSALLFASLYPMLDLLTRLTNRNFVIKLIVLFHLSDLLFTYLLFGINQLPAPHSLDLAAYNTVFESLPRLYWSGIVSAIITSIVEVLIYVFLQKRIKTFFVASMISTVTMLLIHNVPTDIFAFYGKPHWKTMVVANFITCISTLFIYTSLANFFLRRIDKSHKDQMDLTPEPETVT